MVHPEPLSCHGRGGLRFPAGRGEITGPSTMFSIHKTQKLGSMSRPRTPTALLELRSAFKRNPDRKRARENELLVTTPLHEPPRRLSKPVKLAWKEMQAHGFWRTSADRFLLEIAPTPMSRRRTDAQSAETSLLIGLLGKLGLSPKERGALNLPTRTI